MSPVQDKCMHEMKKCMRNASVKKVVLEVVKGDKQRMAVWGNSQFGERGVGRM